MIPTASIQTIVLKGCLGNYDEGIASGNLTPGMLVEPTTAARDDYERQTWQAHGTAKGASSRHVVTEDVFQAGLNVGVGNAFFGGTIADVIPSGSLIRLHYCEPGDELWMFVKASNGAVTPAVKLCSAGNGYLQTWTGSDSNPNVVLFQALESKNNSANVQRIRVRAL